MTEECLDSLHEESPDEVIVVDDGSPLPLGPITVSKFIRLPSNQGYPRAVNAGWFEATGDVIITANNDIVFYPDWLKHLLFPLDNGYDISSIRTTEPDGWTTEDNITEGEKFGSLWAMKREVYETLGGLDERFGQGYFEDTDYWRRALEAGFRIGKNHRGLVEHRGHATFDVVDPENLSYARNLRVYAEKHGRVD